MRHSGVDPSSLRRPPGPPARRRPLVLGNGRSVAMSCPKPSFFDKLRRRTSLDASLEEAMVLHLSEPCDRCWHRLDSLPALAEPDARPNHGRPTLPYTDSPVVLALRTVGGWPPRLWLRPGRRDALERVDGPLGFLRLVIQEARAWAPIYGHGLDELQRWVDLLDSQRPPGRGDLALESFYAHSLLCLAEIKAKRSPGTAAELLNRASLVHDQAFDGRAGELSCDPLFDAHQLVVQAALAEKLGPDFAHQEYQLAAARLVEHRHAPHRVEILLRHADFLTRAGRLDEAQTCLVDARVRLARIDEGHLLEESTLHHASTLALAEALAAPHGSLRHVARLAEARGILARTLPLGLEFDPAIAQRRGFLVPRLEDAERALGPLPDCKTDAERDDLLEVWTLYRDVPTVRRLVEPILNRVYPRDPDSGREDAEENHE